MDSKTIEMARKLGKAIQADERYEAYHKAKVLNDSDEELQEAIGEFNLLRQKLNAEVSKSDESKDQGKIEELNAQAQEAYSKIMANPNMEVFSVAKEAMDSMVSEISTIISLCCDGEDPDTCEVNPAGGCGSGGCGSCGGCH